MLDLGAFLLTNLVFLFTSVIQSVVGFGFNIIGVPFLTVLEGSQAAVAIVSIPSFINCFLITWRIRQQGANVSLKGANIGPLLGMAALGSALGTYLLVALDASVIRIALGLLLLLFVATDQLRKNWRPNPRHLRPIAIGIGGITGILNGLAGISGPTLAPYLYALKLEKEQFVYVINILFIALGVYQLTAFGLAGFYTSERVVFAVGLIPVSLFGVALGARLRARVNQTFFNRLVLVVLLVTGLDLMRRGLHIG